MAFHPGREASLFRVGYLKSACAALMLIHSLNARMLKLLYFNDRECRPRPSVVDIREREPRG
jgi:hypothetical protein